MPRAAGNRDADSPQLDAPSAERRHSGSLSDKNGSEYSGSEGLAASGSDVQEELSNEMLTPCDSGVLSSGDDAQEAEDSRETSDSDSDSSDGESPADDYCTDTDLEIEDEKTDFHMSGGQIYLEACRELNVVPVSYFVRHMQDDRLVMRHHGLGPQGAQALAIPLVTNTSVTSLDLQDNWIEGDGARHLAEMLKDNCYISYLTISDNRLRSEGAEAICDMLQYNSSLLSVNLSGNGFEDKDASIFAEAILTNSTLKELILRNNQFGFGAGAILGHAIGENETLEELDLSWNHFRGRAALDVIEGVKVNTRLKRINLSWNGLGNEGALAIAECIKQNHVITDIDISNNRITSVGAVAIAKALDTNETLQAFRIGQNAIGTEGALDLLQAINNDRSVLLELDLTDICVSQEFDTLHQEILQSRDNLVVRHGGVLGMIVHRRKKNKDELEPEELAAFKALENFLQNDPMALLQAYVKKKNLRLLDLFKDLDKNKDFRVTMEDLKRSVVQSGIDLSSEKIEQLIGRLDKTKDGKIDYSTLSGGSSEMVLKRRRLSNDMIRIFHANSRTSLPPHLSASPVVAVLGSRLKMAPGRGVGIPDLAEVDAEDM